MTISRFANSLFTRLVVLGVVAIIVSGLARYQVLIHFLKDDQSEVAGEQQGTIADYLAQDIGYRVAERRQFLDRLASTLPPALLDDPAALREWLQVRQEVQPLFSEGLFFADAQGLIVVDYPTMNGRRALWLTVYPDYARVLEGATVVGEPLVSPASKRPTLPMLAPVRDARGRVAGVLGGTTELDAPGFLQHLQQARMGPSGSFLLISPAQNLIIGASNPSLIWNPLPATGADTLLDRARQGWRGHGVGSDGQGHAEIQAFAAVPGTPWLVETRLPLAAALPTVERTRQLIARGTVVQAAVIFLIILVAWLWYFRPLRRAAEQADRMTRGEIALSPLPVLRRDEVGYLTMAFNGLLARLRLHHAELQHQAHHDVLTGLPNRMMLAERMAQALAHACREQSGIALLFLDLDGFKPINDRLGHKTGDQVLQTITQRLRQVARHGDTLARVGGDEFVLLAADLGVPLEHGARALAEKCIKVVSEPLALAQGQHQLGVSIGIAVCDGRCDADSLLQAADRAMYLAKAQGRGCYVIAPAEMACGHASVSAPAGIAGTSHPTGSAHS